MIMEGSFTFQKKLYLLGIVFFIALVLLAALLFYKSTKVIKPDTSKSSNNKQPLIKKETTGKFTLKSSSDQNIYLTGEEIILNLFADSYGESIVAWDFVLEYNSQAITFVSAESMHQDFDIFADDNQSKIILTGVKKIEVENPTIYKDAVVARIRLRVENKGPAGFKAQFTPGKLDDSNLMDQKSRDILEEVSLDPVYVGEEVILTTLSDSFDVGDLSISLIEKNEPSLECRDCQDIIKIQLKDSSGKNKTIEFVSGGLYGLEENTAEFDDYIIEAVSIEEGRVRIANMGRQ